VCVRLSSLNKTLQVEQLDKLEQYTTSAAEAVAAEGGDLGELSQKFYQAAVQVCVCVCVKGMGIVLVKQNDMPVIESYCSAQ